MKHLSNTKSSKNNSAGIAHIRKADLLLLGGTALLALVIFLGYKFFFQKTGAAVEISIDGKVMKTLSLDEETTYHIISENNHENVLQIKNGFASITNADCPDKLCVKQKKINKNGETLVCLPHKVVVTVISSRKEEEFDGVSN